MKITIEIVSFWIVCGLLGYFIPLSCNEPLPPEPCQVSFFVDLHNQDLSTENPTGSFSLFEIKQPGEYTIYTTAIFDTIEKDESFTYIIYDDMEKPAFIVDANFTDGLGTRYYVVQDDSTFEHNQETFVYSGRVELRVGFYRLEPDHYRSLNPNSPSGNTVRVIGATVNLKTE